MGKGKLLPGHHPAAGAGPDAAGGPEHTVVLSGGLDGDGDRGVFEPAVRGVPDRGVRRGLFPGRGEAAPVPQQRRAGIQRCGAAGGASDPGTDETARPGREDFVAGLYEQAAQSADPKIREWATYTVASRCIARGDLDRAEALLDQISNTHRDKRELLSALRRKQGRTEEAWTLLERELFDRAHGIQTTLLSLIEMAQAEGDRQRAQGFCDAARRAGEALDLSDYAVLSAPFQLAAAEQDGPAALDLLDRLLHSLTVPWDLSASPLYRHLATKEAAGEAQSVLLEPLLDQVEADPDCAFLREMPEYGTMVEKYRRAADEA